MDLPVQRVLRPATLPEALAMLAGKQDGVRVVAGGTDLLVQLRAGRRVASTLIDISRLELAGIQETERGLLIGALTPMALISAHPAVQRVQKALAAAASQVGAWPIQCRATLGGNLVNASPAADTAPPLLTAGASVTLASLRGQRQIALEELFAGPGKTQMAPGELLVSILVPTPKVAKGRTLVDRFVKVGPRKEQVISVVSMAGRVVKAADGTLELVRLAFGSVAPTPRRARGVERLLERRVLDVGLIREACRALQVDVTPIDDVRAPASYRRLACAVLLDRFLEEVAGA
jgi:CO/xanthine dehydrogenase FAD-binding subunit